MRVNVNVMRKSPSALKPPTCSWWTLAYIVRNLFPHTALQKKQYDGILGACTLRRWSDRLRQYPVRIELLRTLMPYSDETHGFILNPLR